MLRMKQILLILAVVMSQSVLAADKKPLTMEESAKVIEAAIRRTIKKPTGELTKADLEKVTTLGFNSTKITDAGIKDIAKLQKLERLWLSDAKITRKGAFELSKALPKCEIHLSISVKPTRSNPWSGRPACLRYLATKCRQRLPGISAEDRQDAWPRS